MYDATLKPTYMNKYSLPTLTQFLEETDNEMLRYMLGGYKQTAKTYIDNYQLYPLRKHTKNLLTECDIFLESVQAIDTIIPKEIIGINKDNSIEHRPLEYDDIVDKQYIKTVVVKKNTSRINASLEATYRDVIGMLQWEPIGLISCFPSTGFVFTHYEQDSYVDTYQFIVSGVVNRESKNMIELTYKETWRYSITNNFLSKKHEYLYTLPRLSSMPACLLVTAPLHLPKQETILPLIKELLPEKLQSHV
jgi:hypothetical protein